MSVSPTIDLGCTAVRMMMQEIGGVVGNAMLSREKASQRKPVLSSGEPWQSSAFKSLRDESEFVD